MFGLLLVTYETVTCLIRRLRFFSGFSGFDRSNRQQQEDSYAIRHGYAVIFNNIHFSDGQRNGTKEDETMLKQSLENLGLDVLNPYTDVDTTTLLKELQKVAKMDHSKMDCVVCVILSHGQQDEMTQEGERRMCDLIQCKNGPIAARKLVDCLTDDKAPTLVDKPRLFFIQTCRGTAMPATLMVNGDGCPPKRVEHATWNALEKTLAYNLPVDLPVYPDFLVAWSTMPGYFSFRSKCGSPFIKHLCDGLCKYKERDLLTILTSVQSDVANTYLSKAPSTVNTPEKRNIHNKKQMPWVASMLTRNVYFCKD